MLRCGTKSFLQLVSRGAHSVRYSILTRLASKNIVFRTETALMNIFEFILGCRRRNEVQGVRDRRNYG